MDYKVLIFLVIFVLEAIIGICSNMFILLVIFYDWLRAKIVASVNKILVALIISNICSALVILISVFSDVSWFQTNQTSEFSLALFAVTMFWLTSSSWLTACLCIFCFIKIIPFTSGFLALVKMKIDSAVCCMILVAEVVAVCSISIQIIICINPPAPRVTISMNSAQNITQKASLIPLYAYVAFVSNCVCFLITFCTMLSTVCSLTLHSHRMERNTGSTGTSPLKTHRRPVLIMISLLLFYAIYYVGLFFYYGNPFATLSLEYWLYLVMMFSFTPFQSVLLIYGNPRMKVAFQRVLDIFVWENLK